VQKGNVLGELERLRHLDAHRRRLEEIHHKDARVKIGGKSSSVSKPKQKFDYA